MADITIRIIGEDRSGAPIDRARARVEDLGDSGRRSGGMLSTMFSTAGGFLAANVIGGLASQFGELAGQLIAGPAEFERYEAQFASLMGDVDQARQHIQDLSAFAARTPFELPDVIQASRSLLTFGGAALNTQENLTLVGNAAAAASAPVTDVAFWVGRAYNAIQNGQPFGEAAARLQELGILGGDARLQVEQLAAAGASSAEVWQAFTGGLTAPADAMDQLGQTAEGLQSTFNDSVAALMRTAGQPIFDVYKAGLQGAIAVMNDPAVQAGVQAVATGIASIIQQVTTADGWLTQIQSSLGGTGVSAQTLADLWSTTLLPAIQAVQQFLVTDVQPILATLASTALPLLGAAAQVLGGIWQQVLWPALQVVAGFVRDHVVPVLARLAEVFQRSVVPAIQAAAEWFTTRFLPGAQRVGTFLADTFGPILGRLVDLLGAAIPVAIEGAVAILTEFFSLVGDGWRQVETFVGWVLSLVGGLESVQRGVSYVTTGIQQLIDWLSRIEIPDWMTPGSPTPLELGLRGVARTITAEVNPALASMSRAAAPAAAPVQVESTVRLSMAGGGSDLLRQLVRAEVNDAARGATRRM